ncbi:hypothetical protein ABZ250_02515 [Streptomyces afghaniensis]|uniref:Uncharacterized protein n=1 Tax=Streptomyces afghaniensis 772 TaxID=1283301 RepID=S4NT06_9ACTN|nr:MULTISPECIES: hypothetical protein [Streptomyces]EPJ41559.1 hypothetical protein STAFG_1402 [Streptomyces afghaniensis 772]UOB12810.1 hypothetical protein MQE23_28820 [Streptomyces sp. HP-A2021]
MRNYQKAAVVMAMLGSVSFLGAGVGHASDGGNKVKIDNDQNQACAQNDAQTGLIQLDDVNVSVGAILGWSQQDNSEKESLACSQSFGKH